MHIGLQTTFNQPIGLGQMQRIASKGFTLARIDLQGVVSRATMLECVYEAHGAWLRPLVIVRDWAQVYHLPEGLDVELRNEPDIHVGGEMKPAAYAEYVSAFAEACKTRGHTGWIGAISNLNKHSLGWLRELWRHLPVFPDHIGVSVHRYPNGNSWVDPHDGFGTRLEEIQALRSIIGYRRFAVTEFGYHTAKRKPKGWYRRLFWPRLYDRWTDDQALSHIRSEIAFWRQQEAEFVVLYQLASGPSSDPLDNYGITRVDGSWKPQADAATLV